MKLWKHIRAILMLPFMVTIIIPAAILFLTKTTHLNVTSFEIPVFLFLIFGFIFIGIGLLIFIHTIKLFAHIGQGTLAPWNPTKQLVIKGVYRYVRNPMISSVCFIVLGEALIFKSILIFCWFLIFLTLNVIYIPLFEEKALIERFGKDYLSYKKHVPMWLPRLKAWIPNFKKHD